MILLISRLIVIHKIKVSSNMTLISNILVFNLLLNLADFSQQLEAVEMGHLRELLNLLKTPVQKSNLDKAEKKRQADKLQAILTGTINTALPTSFINR